MTNPSAGPQLDKLRVFFAYTLFVCSGFATAGIEGSIGFLYLLALAALWVYGVEQKLPWWLVGGFVALPGAAVVTALANPAPLTTLASLHSDFRIFLPLALLPVFFKLEPRRLLFWWAVVMAVMGVYGAIQHFWGIEWLHLGQEKSNYDYTGGFRSSGNFSTPFTYAGIMLMASPIFAALAWQERLPVRWLWWGAAALSALAVVFSISRGSWLGLAVAYGFFTLRLPRRFSVPLIGLGLLAAVVLAWGLASGAIRERLKGDWSQAPIVRRFLEIDLENERIYLWRYGLMAIQDRPWLGYGMNNDEAMAPYREKLLEKYPGYRFLVDVKQGLHNMYLAVLSYMGLLGLLAYGWFWGGVFWWNGRWIQRAGDKEPFYTALLWGCSAAMAGALAEGFFEANFFDAEVQAVIMMVFGLSLYAGKALEQKGVSESSG